MSGIRRLRDFLSRVFACIRCLGRHYTPLTMDEMIKEAINEKRLLEFDYMGFHRIIEPHVYGSKFEKDGMMTYQVKGQSSSGVLGWKRMYLEKVTDMGILDEKFTGKRPVPGKHSSWDVIYLIVDE